MKKLLTALIFGSVIIFVSCDKDDDPVDTTAPTITLEEPENGEVFKADETIHFDALFEDDIELATFNLTIHDNFDGHSHGRTMVAPFTFDQSFPLTGKVDDIHEEIEIGAEATAGPYHFIVEAIDAAGNSTTFADNSSIELEIWVTNTGMAHVHFEDANGNEVAEYDGTVGEALKFYGEIEDEVGMLDHVEIKVGHLEEAAEHDHDHARTLEEAIYEGDFEVEGETSVRIEDLLSQDQANIIVTQEELDELEEEEHLYLIVIAEDEDGNISRHSIEIHFD